MEYKKSNFKIAFLFLGKEKFNSLSIIYDFFRMVDDIVDSDSDKEIKFKKINEIKNKINDIYNNKQIDDSFYLLKCVIDKYKIPKYCFDEFLKGMEKDIEDINIKTIYELEKYMYQVASIVGITVLHICEYNGDDKENIAKYTGYALQLTNILRDIDEDLKRNRIYIPEEHRKSFLKTDKLDLKSPEFKKLFEFEKNITKDYYKKADEFFKKNKSKKLLASSVMKNIYYEIFKSLDFKKITKNHKISNYKKIKAVFKSLIETIL